MCESLGDNPVMKINGRSLERLKSVFNLVHGFPAYGYAVAPGPHQYMVFFKYENTENMTPFPTKLSADRCAEIAFEWLSQQQYPQEPDHDGHNEEGWLVWNDGWGQIDGYGYSSFIAIEPMWIMFGK